MAVQKPPEGTEGGELAAEAPVATDRAALPKLKAQAPAEGREAH
jgi:hypothetical protein